ncbi:hypothetical protein [Aliarcobacter butzleri]|uniref:hypothetical protein n=1 Tax=Aliarcobacter butzleri TaxID=28197 RepID=UPI002B25561A|nr:hypothetical protein [Aliarcobacter butzleri]
MGMCKGCGVVYSALVMKDGYCRDCKPMWFDESGEPIKGAVSIDDNVENKKQETKDNQTLGIISFVLSILTFFMGGIVGVIFASISIICGSGSYKNAFGIIGIVISSIYLVILFLTLLGFVSIMALN